MAKSTQLSEVHVLIAWLDRFLAFYFGGVARSRGRLKGHTETYSAMLFNCNRLSTIRWRQIAMRTRTKHLLVPLVRNRKIRLLELD